MFLTGDPWWASFTVAAATAGTELVIRVAGPALPLPGEAAWVALGLVAPPAVWGTLLTVASIEEGVGWNIHIVSGLITYTALVGIGTVLVARNVRPPSRIATTEPSAQVPAP
jgi:hypothetical protein